MGKASKWFRGLLGLKKHDPSPPSNQTPNPTKQTKKKWSFVKSYKEKDYGGHVSNSLQNGTVCVDPTKRAMAVAEATAVVAEAAIAAAQAAAAVVKLTSSGRATATANINSNNNNTSGDGGAPALMTWNGVSLGSSTVAVKRNGVLDGNREDFAAVIIQSHFRAYLSRRALRALKGLVKLQALVRGHIVRQQTADYLRQMQAIARAQSRARAGRSQVSGSPHSTTKFVQFLHADPTTPEKFEHVIRARSLKHDETFMLKRNTSKSNWKVIDSEKARIRPQGSSARTSSIDDEKICDKILEIDIGKPYVTPKQRNVFHSSHLSLNSDHYSYNLTTSKESTAHQTVPSPSSCGNQPLSPLKFNEDLEEPCFCTADNSPQFYSASSNGGSSKRGPFTPTKSDGSRSWLSGYSGHPNYMSYTESAKAKVRSMSAPKQRPNCEKSSSIKRYSIHAYGESRTNSQKGSFYAGFTGKAYPGSGRLDRLGMPVIRADPSGFSGGLRHRY